MGQTPAWPQQWGWETSQWGPNQLRKQLLTFQGRIRPTKTRHMESGREGLGQHKCSPCTEYNKSIFRRKRFLHQML